MYIHLHERVMLTRFSQMPPVSKDNITLWYYTALLKKHTTTSDLIKVVESGEDRCY